MSVLIKGMEMPTSCFDCPFMYGRRYCRANSKIEFNDPDYSELKGRYDGCPLVPVPKHGRLGDLDALITTFCEWGTRLERGRKLVITMSEAKQAIVDIIEDAPTIIPAEEGEVL